MLNDIHFAFLSDYCHYLLTRVIICIYHSLKHTLKDTLLVRFQDVVFWRCVLVHHLKQKPFSEGGLSYSAMKIIQLSKLLQSYMFVD